MLGRVLARACCAAGNGGGAIVATAGLSLGEYTALHLAGAFDFATGLRLVARRGAMMQEAAESSRGSMVALIGATEEQADAVCAEAQGDGVLIPANYNAPGQIVISGNGRRPVSERSRSPRSHELRATPLAVAGAFHSPLMQPAADAMGAVLAEADICVAGAAGVVECDRRGPSIRTDLELLRARLVEQIVHPVRWAQGCQDLIEKVNGAGRRP